MPTTMQQELAQATRETVITLDEREVAIHTVIQLQELFQPSGSSQWSSRGKTSLALHVGHTRWLFRVPSAEAGAPLWLDMALIAPASSFRTFYRGGDAPSEWGPARRFAKADQQGDVQYELKGQRWVVRDIGAFRTTVDGTTDVSTTNDRLYFVTSQSVDGQEWLVYLDARPGEASGTGGLFRGKSFNPEVAISAVL